MFHCIRRSSRKLGHLRPASGVACCLFQTTLADTADKPPYIKSTFKKASRHPAPTTTLDSQKVHAHPAPQSHSSELQLIPSHPKAAPTSSRAVPSISEAAYTAAKGVLADPVPSVTHKHQSQGSPLQPLSYLLPQGRLLLL